MRIRFMVLFAFVAVAAAVPLVLAASQASQAETMLEAARKIEVVDGNYAAAIKQYQAIVEKFAKTDRRVAAMALLRIANTYKKFGDKQAEAVLQRIVTEFKDQAAQVTEARAMLAAAGSPDSIRVAVEAQLLCRNNEDGCGGGTISLDGRWLLMGGNTWGGNLAIRDMNTGQVRTLNVTADNPAGANRHSHDQVFSPDTRSIAYHWGDDVSELRVVRNEPGAVPRTVVSRPEHGSIETIAWPTADQILVKIRLKADQTDQLAWVSPATGTLRTTRSLGWRMEDTTLRSNITLSPDGRFIVYSALAESPSVAPTRAEANRLFGTADQRLYLIRSDGSGAEIELMKTRGIDNRPNWSADGSHLLFSSNRAGSVDLWALPMLDGKSAGFPFRVKADIGNYDNIGVTAAGLYYYEQRHPSLDQVVLAEFDAASKLPAPPKVLHRFPGRLPSWSPDGRLLALARGPRNGATGHQIAVHAIETGDERVFAVSEIPDRRAIWLPDGSGLIQILSPAAARTERIWRKLDLKRGTFEKMPGLPNPMFFNVPQLAADGRTLFMLGGPLNPHGEFDQIVAIDTETNSPRVVFTLPNHNGSATSGTGPALSPDGRTLAFSWRPADSDEWKFATVAIDGTRFRELQARAARPPFELVWMRDGRSLLFNVGDGAGRYGCRLMRLSLEEGRAEPTGLLAQSEMACQGTFVLSPDGRRIAYQSIENANELWALNVSAAALAKKQR